MAEGAPAVAGPHTGRYTKSTIRSAAPMAHEFAAIDLGGAGLDGDLYGIAANGDRNVAPMLDLIHREHDVAVPSLQERFPELANTG